MKKEGTNELKKKGMRKKMMIKLSWQWVCSINQAKTTVVHKSTLARMWIDVGILRVRVDEIARTRKATTIEILARFCDGIETLYTRDYLRKPLPRDLQRLIQKV
ncbi:unnamed protein product [Prunus brigantina]